MANHFTVSKCACRCGMALSALECCFFLVSSSEYRFVQKQGLDRTFVECENHMWRVGNRPLPRDITVDGGSDWIAINRNYSHYLVTNKDLYLTELKRYYQYSLLPAEVTLSCSVTAFP